MDPLLTILAQDPAFVGAVKQQDVDAAAHAAFEVLKVRNSTYFNGEVWDML